MPHRTADRRRAASFLAVALLVLACTPATASIRPSSSGLGSPTAAPERRPVIVDTDLDHSDIAALLVLLRDPALDVRAITIAGTGLVHCAGGRTVLRYLLEQMGAADMPSGCGRQHGGPDARPFPDDWRSVADAGYGLPLTPRVEPATPPGAVEVMLAAIADSPAPPLLVTLGPLTNVEDALAADPSMVERVSGVHAMLATIDAPGNVYVDGHTGADPLEWNAFADPSSVTAVLATDLPIVLIPLDATGDVPIPTDLADRLASDHVGAGADLLYELLIRHPARLRADEGQQLWDELAALAVTRPDLVTWQDATVAVGEDGRIRRDAGGRPVRFADGADRVAVEDALLVALRRGAARPTPFAIAGELTVTWDGSRCTMTGEAPGPGLYQIRFSTGVTEPAGTTILALEAPHTWADVERFLADLDVETSEQPAWVRIAGSVGGDGSSSGVLTFTAAFEAGTTYGATCLEGAWPDVRFTLASPFTVG